MKAVARELLVILKQEMLVLDWRKKQQTRAAVRVAIETILDSGLPVSYDADRFSEECDEVFQHVFESYADAALNRYATV